MEEEKVKEFKEEKKEEKPKVRESKRVGERISGIKSDFVLFRFGKEIKRIPVTLWNGEDKLEFSEKEFKEFANK